MVTHCPRNLVTLSPLDSTDGLPGKAAVASEAASLAWMTLLQNHENKTVEWLVAFG